MGITGYIFKDQDNGIQALMRDDDLPLEKLLIETDAPFMFLFVDKANFDDDISKTCSCLWLTNEPAAMPLVCELVAAFKSNLQKLPTRAL